MKHQGTLQISSTELPSEAPLIDISVSVSLWRSQGVKISLSAGVSVIVIVNVSWC